MTLKTIKKHTRVFHKKEDQVLTIINTIGFVKEGKNYIPCADDKNNIDDYCIDDLIVFSGEKPTTENIYLDRLRQQYKLVKELISKDTFYLNGYDQAKKIYDGMRLFCLDTELVSFNDIELMESSFS